MCIDNNSAKNLNKALRSILALNKESNLYQTYTKLFSFKDSNFEFLDLFQRIDCLDN